MYKTILLALYAAFAQPIVGLKAAHRLEAVIT